MITTFNVNIFGTSHAELEGGADLSFEFILHVLQVECNVPIVNFDMFLEFYAFPWEVGDGAKIFTPNFPTITNRVLNNRPSIVHINQMTPIAPVVLYTDCSSGPALPCPVPSDMRLFSMPFQTPRAGIAYDPDNTDMTNISLLVAALPMNITIIADGCKYTSQIGTSVNIYRAYGSSSLFGGLTNNPSNLPIGFNEKILIS